MKLGIAARLALVLALVGALAAGLTGYYIYQASRDIMVASAKAELLVSAHAMVKRMAGTRESVSRNLRLLATHPSALASLQQPTPTALNSMATLFASMMQAQPSFIQIRLIGRREHGLEVVRVDRAQAGPVRIAEGDLQEKGHYAYVSEGLKLAAGQTYLSRLAVSHETGTHLGEGKPTVVMVMPVADPAGHSLGVVAINVDLEGTFDLLLADLPRGVRMYLANSTGDFLLHPVEAMRFGFDRGLRHLVQDQMPPTLALVQRRVNELVFDLPRGEHVDSPLVAAFLTQETEVASGDGSFILGLAQPLADVLATVNNLQGAIVNIVLGLSLASLLVAVVLARALSRPINAIGQAARFFAQGQVYTTLPTQRQDEIGDLARSFSRMQDQISRQLEELEVSRRELSDLARLDGLTGLANRRLFDERLALALARYRRHGVQLALLFLDLDRFKEVNDAHGHEAGDVVLQVVAQRIKANTREVDTPARLGGDEFVVLVSAVEGVDQLEALALKLMATLAEPIQHGDLLLTVGCSIGISRTPVDGDTPEQLKAAADEAMYEVKQAGRNGYRVATPLVSVVNEMG